MKARFTCSQWALSSAVLVQYSSMLMIFLRRWGSAILAQTMRRSSMVRILKRTFSWKWTQEMALKARQRSFRLDFPEVFSMNYSVILFQLQVRQLQWNIRMSVFYTFSSISVTQRTHSRFLPAQNYTRNSLRLPFSFSFYPSSATTSSATSPPFRPKIASIRSAVNFFRGRSRTNSLMKYLWVSSEPSTSPMTYGLEAELIYCGFFFEFWLRLCSEKTTLCISNRRTLSSILISIRLAFCCWSRLLCANNPVSSSTNSRSISSHLGEKRMAAKSEQLRHFKRRLYSRKISLSSSTRITSFGFRLCICGSRNPSIRAVNASAFLTNTTPYGVDFNRSKF